MKQIKIGQVVNAVGIKGELRVYPYIKDSTQFSQLEKIFLEKELCEIENVRYMKHLVVMKVKGVDTRDGAEAQKGKNIYIDREALWNLPENTYLIEDLLGMNVYTQEGQKIGTLVNVIQKSSQDLYEIEREEGSRFLLPAVLEFILEINVKEKKMTVKIIEGLMELSL